MTDVAGGSLKSLREGNRERLIALLREHGSLHRAELARRAGVSRATVSTIVTELLADGVVVEGDGENDGDTPAGGTRAGKRAGLTLNPSAGYVAGLDFSATSLIGVIADLSHEVVAHGVRSLPVELSWEQRLDIGVQLVEEMVRDAGIRRDRLLNVGLGVPGPVNWFTGEVGSSSHTIKWQGAHAAERLRERLGVPVTQDNTASLGALGEAAWGAAQGCRNVLYVKISTGIGAGLVIDGRVYRGALGATGALGHVSVVPDGAICSCGSRGCLELYAAVPAILAELQPMYGVLTLAEVIDMAESGNRATVRVLREAALTLGRGLAGFCNMLNPERIVIGGELARAGELFLAPVREGLERHALPIVTHDLGVIRGELGERAGALGGVALMLRQVDQS